MILKKYVFFIFKMEPLKHAEHCELKAEDLMNNCNQPILFYETVTFLSNWFFFRYEIKVKMKRPWVSIFDKIIDYPDFLKLIKSEPGSRFQVHSETNDTFFKWVKMLDKNAK